MKRTNTAKWIESAHRWQINVQKDGVRKTFTSAKPGRTGQLKQLVGHSENMDTYGTYAHALSTDAAETAANLETVFGKILGPESTH